MSIRRRLYIRRRGLGLNRGIRSSRMVCGERLLCLLVAREVEVEIQTWINVSSLLLKSKPPRSPLSIGLVPQSSNNFVPLSNQSYLLMKVPTQSTALLSQAFHRVQGLGSLTMSPVQQRYLIAQFIIGRKYLLFRLPQLVLGCNELIPNHLKLILRRLQPVPSLCQVILRNPQLIPNLLKLAFGCCQVVSNFIFSTFCPITGRHGVLQIIFEPLCLLGHTLHPISQLSPLRCKGSHPHLVNPGGFNMALI